MSDGDIIQDLLVNLAAKATRVLRTGSKEDKKLLELVANDYVTKGGMGELYRSRTMQWLLGATDHLFEKMKVKQQLPDMDAFYEAYEAWEVKNHFFWTNPTRLKKNTPFFNMQEAEDDHVEEPREEQFLKEQFLEFGVGWMGSVWFDTDLTGTVDGVSITKKTRVSLDPTEQISGNGNAPLRIVLDATFDERF